MANPGYQLLGGTLHVSFQIQDYTLNIAEGGLGQGRNLWLPDFDGNVPAIDGTPDVMRWGSTGAKTYLFVPVVLFGIGEPGAAGIFNAVNVTVDCTYHLPAKNGTMALTNDIDPAAISGFTIRTTATTIVISSGHAITDTGVRVNYAGGTITTSRASNTTYHIYIQDNGTILRSTTAPGSPFSGTARGLSGSPGRRYLGSVRTGDGTTASNYILQESEAGGSQVNVRFLPNTGLAPLVIHSAGSDTTAADATAVNLAPAGPTNYLRVRCYQNGGAGLLVILCYNGGSFNTWTNLPVAGAINTLDIPCDGTPKFQYLVNGAATASLNLMGYGYAR